MSDKITHPLFSGSGGGGGKSGGSEFTNTPDNLRSTDTFEGLMGVAIGPIKGAVDGLKSVRMDGTAIENATGEPNFPDFAAVYTQGDPTLHPQIAEMRLGAASAPQSVNVAVPNDNTGTGTTTPGPWVSRTLANPGPNYIDLRFVVNQLFRQNEDGIFTTTATLEIEMKPTTSSEWINPTNGDPGAWTGSSDGSGKNGSGLFGIIRRVDQATTNSQNFKINAKTVSPTAVELRIWVPNEGNYLNATWDVRVRLLERNDYTEDDVVEQRQILWESMAAIYNTPLGASEGWRGLAWLQLYGKASDNLRGVPEVEIELDGKIVKTPPSAIFDAETRVYTPGLWDGSWSMNWTNDPAWIINDVISDPISGLAKFAPGAHLNKWDALAASKWFSELVPDGQGGFHPRYSLNFVHNQPMKGEEFVRYLGGAVGALVWDDGSGEWRMKVDKPETPVDIFTLENIEGEFVYNHTDVDTRFNDFRGSFLNAEFDYREETINVVDNTSIALLGHKPTNIALIGCTNRQEAARRLMLRLRSATRETRIVNFTTNRRADHLLPLDVILIADGDLGDIASRTTGRVVTVAPDRLSLQVRDPMRLEVGVDYQLRFAVPNLEYDPDAAADPTANHWKEPTLTQAIDIVNTSGQRGNVTDIYLADPLPADVAEYLVVALEATGLTTLPKQYRIIGITKNDDGERVSMSAVEIDTGKWDAADAVTTEDMVYQDLTQVAPMPLPPSSGPIANLVTTPAAQGLNHSIIVNWNRPLGSLVDGFRVFYTVNGGPQQILAERALIPTVDLVNPTFGDYKFYIHTITRTGVLSQPLEATLTVNQSVLDAADIAYTNGETLESLQPAAAGADPTGANIAAGIFGQGSLATQDNVDWGADIINIPGNVGNATSALTLYKPNANEFVEINGNYISQSISFWGWNVLSHEYSVGSAYVSFRMYDNGSGGRSQGVVGIPTEQPASVNGAEFDYGIFPQNNGQVWVIDNGNEVNSGITWNTGDVFALAYEGSRVIYYKNGSIFRVTTDGVVPNRTCYLGAFLYNGTIGDLRFLPLTSGQGTISGPASQAISYDHTVTPLTGELPKDLNYSLAVNGVPQTTGVTWTYQVLTGTVNGFTNSSGVKSMTGTGAGTFTVSSLGSDTATVRISALTSGSIVATQVVLSLSRQIATPPSGSNNLATGSISGTTDTSSYADKSGTINGTMPAGKTTARVVATCNVSIAPTGSLGFASVTFKLMRNISSVWTQVGSSVVAIANEIYDSETESYYIETEGAVLDISDTGLTAGNSYQWRIEAARTGGGRTANLSGAITVTAP